MPSPSLMSAFIAGLIAFLAPCTLPLVPGYLAFMSGVSLQELKNGHTRSLTHRNIFFNSVLFTLGFAVIFIILGALAGLIGYSLLPYRLIISQVGGSIIIVFGLYMIGLFRIPFLEGDHHIVTFRALVSRPFRSFLLGMAFGSGWSPCLGPILGSILFLASQQATLESGALLLAVFSLGMAIPFLMMAWGISWAMTYMGIITRYLRGISIVGGILLILLGIVMLTGNAGILLAWFAPLLDSVDYDRLRNYF